MLGMQSPILVSLMLETLGRHRLLMRTQFFIATTVATATDSVVHKLFTSWCQGLVNCNEAELPGMSTLSWVP